MPEERAALAALRDGIEPAAAELLAQDGWRRYDSGPWSALFHGEPLGWSPMPGHGHQDCGAPEIHFAGEALFVDPGRGSYALAGEADPFVAGGVHGGLLVDDFDPYPPNRPYYAPAFRASAAGAAQLRPTEDGIRVSHGGLRRLGVGQVEREWSFAPHSLTIRDTLTGLRPGHHVRRQLVTGLEVEVMGEAVILRSAVSGRRFKVMAQGCPPSLEPTTLWSAYGRGRPGHVLVFRCAPDASWQGRLTVDLL